MAARKRYFRSWGGYVIPYRPVGEITEEEARELRSYYVGEYNDGSLLNFEKIVDGEREWIDYYTYDTKTSAIKSRKMVKADGSIIEQLFDPKGKIVR
jgi:hypothetical protein